MNSAEKGWKDVPIGGLIIEAGSSEKYETGDWRTYRPVWDKGNCIHCLRCWIYCPDSSILVSEGSVVGIDYKHCKGCGICAHECPVKCIKMLLETEAEAETESRSSAKVSGEAGGK